MRCASYSARASSMRASRSAGVTRTSCRNAHSVASTRRHFAKRIDNGGAADHTGDERKTLGEASSVPQQEATMPDPQTTITETELEDRVAAVIAHPGYAHRGVWEKIREARR